MGLLLLWRPVHAAGHLLSRTSTRADARILLLTAASLARYSFVHVFRERSRQCVSWPFSTSETSSPSTWNWMRLCLDPEPEFLPPSYKCCWYCRYKHTHFYPFFHLYHPRSFNAKGFQNHPRPERVAERAEGKDRGTNLSCKGISQEVISAWTPRIIMFPWPLSTLFTMPVSHLHVYAFGQIKARET